MPQPTILPQADAYDGCAGNCIEDFNGKYVVFVGSCVLLSLNEVSTTCAEVIFKVLMFPLYDVFISLLIDLIGQLHRDVIDIPGSYNKKTPQIPRVRSVSSLSVIFHTDHR